MKKRQKKIPSGKKEGTTQRPDEEAMRRAERGISYLKRQFPGKRLIDLIPVVIRHHGDIAGEVLIARIERNQGEKFSPDDCVYLRQVKDEIAQRKRGGSST